jgi:hypothetical protein
LVEELDGDDLDVLQVLELRNFDVGALGDIEEEAIQEERKSSNSRCWHQDRQRSKKNSLSRLNSIR